jgi:hypothetical protein
MEPISPLAASHRLARVLITAILALAGAACGADPPASTPGCPSTSAKPSGPSEGDAGGTQPSNGQMDLAGRWRICGSNSTHYYLPEGGYLVRIEQQGERLTAIRIKEDNQDGPPLLRGTIDPATRIWTADFRWSYVDADGGSREWYERGAVLTFNKEGTRFVGPLMPSAKNFAETVTAGREDGSFACAK